MTDEISCVACHVGDGELRGMFLDPICAKHKAAYVAKVPGLRAEIRTAGYAPKATDAQLDALIEKRRQVLAGRP